MEEKRESDLQLEYILKQLNLRGNEANDDEECTGDGSNSYAQVVHEVLTSEEARLPGAKDGLVVKSVGSTLSTLKSPGARPALVWELKTERRRDDTGDALSTRMQSRTGATRRRRRWLSLFGCGGSPVEDDPAGENGPPQEEVDLPALLDINDSVETMMEKLRNPHINPNVMGCGTATIHNFARENNYDQLLTLLLYCDWQQLNIDNMDEGNTALHIAAKSGNLDIVKLLLAFGANPVLKNKYGRLPADVAKFQTISTLLKSVSAAYQCAKKEEIATEKRDRMLFLDGGGMRGLLEIEVLMEIERRTGRRITELFDWIVGTSIGGIIALALVYAKRPLVEVRQMLFRIREALAGGVQIGTKWRTDNLEQLLKHWFGDSRMSSETKPKVMIVTVYKETKDIQRHIFNNCFDNGHLCEELVWKVARYTSAAAPLCFSELDDYIDGGFLANNPSQAGWSEMNKHLRPGEKLHPSLIVSVGTGIPPSDPLKEVTLSLKRLPQMLELIGMLVTRSEFTSMDFEAERRRDGTPYYRFNPSDIDVDTLEVDREKLVEMIIITKKYLNQTAQMKDMKEVVQLL